MAGETSRWDVPRPTAGLAPRRGSCKRGPVIVPLDVEHAAAAAVTREASRSIALEARGLEFFYGARPVLRGLDLSVPTGTVFGFLGRNAAGKTTTLRLLIGMLRPSRGSITLGGTTYARVPPAARVHVGYVSQEQHFYDWMRVSALARFVASFYPTWSDDELARLLEVTGIERDQRVGELSGGTKMKLAIVLALAHDPPLVVLDEPTAGVDPAVRREILALVRAQAGRGRTILFSTHQIEEVRAIADRVGILHGGRLVLHGTLDELTQRYRRLAEGAAPPPGAKALARDEAGRLIIDAGDPALDPGTGHPPEGGPAEPHLQTWGEPLSLEDLFFYATGGARALGHEAASERP